MAVATSQPWVVSTIATLLLIFVRLVPSGHAMEIYSFDIKEIICTDWRPVPREPDGPEKGVEGEPPAAEVKVTPPPGSTFLLPMFLRELGSEAEIQWSMDCPNCFPPDTVWWDNKTLASWTTKTTLFSWLSYPLNLFQRVSGPKSWKLRPDAVVERAGQVGPPGASELDMVTRSDTTKELEASEAHCDEFFLLDGRSPVDLPETWEDARAAFASICLDEGLEEETCTEALRSFFGEARVQDSNEAFEPRSGLCEELFGWLGNQTGGIAVIPRRLKSSGPGGGYHSRGGSSSSHGWEPKSIPDRSFGWSSNSLKQRFSKNRAVTYGFAGVVGASVAASWIITRPSEDWTSQETECGDRTCKFTGANLYEDDLFDHVVDATRLRGPWTVKLHYVGSKFREDARSRMCHNEGPQPVGFYFGFVTPDELEWEDDIWWKSQYLWGSVLVCCSCCCGGIACLIFQQQQQERAAQPERTIELSQANRAAGGAFTEGNYPDGFGQPSGPPAPQLQGSYPYGSDQPFGQPVAPIQVQAVVVQPIGQFPQPQRF